MNAVKIDTEGALSGESPPNGELNLTPLERNRRGKIEVAVRTAGEALQMLGAAGYMEEHPAEMWYRDAKQLTIVEGTSQIQRGLIARGVLDHDLWWD